MEYSISKNPQYNSVEITFPGKPSEAIRDALKALKFRWHSVRRVWYGYTTEDAARAAIDGAESSDQPETKAVNESKPAAPSVDKYERLTAVLKSAALYAQTFADVEDGGTCNFDSPVLDYMAEHMQKAKAIKAIQDAGLRCFDWTRCHYPMLVITGFQSGQGNRHMKMAEAFHDYMERTGYSGGMYRQKD